MTASETNIANANDTAALLGIPTSARLSVVLLFNDGSSRNASEDTRAVFNVTTGASLAYLDRDVGDVNPRTVFAAPSVNGSVQVRCCAPNARTIPEP